MEGGKNKIVIGVVVLLVVAVGVYWVVWRGGKKEGERVGAPAAVETPQGVAVAPGASPVSEEGKVIAPSGEVANNAAPPGTQSAPQQSAPVAKEEVPTKAVKLSIVNGKITPNEFEVSRGAAVTLSVTSDDRFTHIFKFKDPSLQAVAVGVGPGETRLITFNAPSQKGEYEFYCDVPSHEVMGEKGKMVVK